jgi:hypothetical protein
MKKELRRGGCATSERAIPSGLPMDHTQISITYISSETHNPIFSYFKVYKVYILVRTMLLL